MSNRFPSRENFRKLMLARLQAVSSMNIYSLHGLDALIRAVFEQVCQSLLLCLSAARRVFPPDFTTAAIWSYTRMNDNGPDGVPPPDSFSFELRMVDRSVPVPDPNLNNMVSLRASRMMSSMLSSTD